MPHVEKSSLGKITDPAASFYRKGNNLPKPCSETRARVPPGLLLSVGPHRPGRSLPSCPLPLRGAGTSGEGPGRLPARESPLQKDGHRGLDELPQDTAVGVLQPRPTAEQAMTGEAQAALTVKAGNSPYVVRAAPGRCMAPTASAAEGAGGGDGCHQRSPQPTLLGSPSPWGF